MSDMRTPLGKVRGLGSAREGTGHFWHQRLTAIANIPLILFFVGFLISLNGASYAEVRDSTGQPAGGLVMILVLVSGLYHMRLGMQVIIEDYVHGEGSKLALLDPQHLLRDRWSAPIALFALLKLAFGG